MLTRLVKKQVRRPEAFFQMILIEADVRDFARGDHHKEFHTYDRQARPVALDQLLHDVRVGLNRNIFASSL